VIATVLDTGPIVAALNSTAGTWTVHACSPPWPVADSAQIGSRRWITGTSVR
jgi:hypothetical protein